MRSSFDPATVIKRVALVLLVAAGTLSIESECLTQSAAADPISGGTSKFVIAQGDASLPAPDSNFHPKSRLSGDFGTAAQSAGPGDLTQEQLMRRRMRRRMKRNAQDLSEQSDINSSAASKDNANANAPNSGAFGGGARRFQGGGGLGLFGKKALDLTSLNLTPEQKQKIQDARRQVAPKTKEIRRQLVAKRAELRDMMFQPDMNDDLVRAKRKEVRQLQDKIEDLQLNDFLAIRSVLTPDQRQKLTDLKPGPKVANGQAQLIAPAVSAQPTP